MLSNVVHLSITSRGLQWGVEVEEHTDAAACLELLRPFTAAVTLDVVSEGLAGHISHALEGVAEEMVAEVMPSLRSLCLKGKLVKRFVSARRLSGRPVTISD